MKLLQDIAKIGGAVVTILGIAWAVAMPHVRDYIKEVVQNEVTSVETLSKVLQSDVITTYSKKIEVKAVENIIKKDSTRVGLRTYIGIKTGIRDNFVGDSLAQLLINSQKPSLYITDEKCIFNSKKYGRRRIVADF